MTTAVDALYCAHCCAPIRPCDCGGIQPHWVDSIVGARWCLDGQRTHEPHTEETR